MHTLTSSQLTTHSHTTTQTHMFLIIIRHIWETKIYKSQICKIEQFQTMFNLTIVLWGSALSIIVPWEASCEMRVSWHRGEPWLSWIPSSAGYRGAGLTRSLLRSPSFRKWRGAFPRASVSLRTIALCCRLIPKGAFKL